MRNLLQKIDITTDAIPMEITDLNGNPLTEDENQRPTIYLYGMDSDHFRNALREIDKDESDRDEILLASCIKSWRHIVNDDGVAIECNTENAIKLLKDYPILKTQADRFIAERANYLKKH